MNESIHLTIADFDISSLAMNSLTSLHLINCDIAQINFGTIPLPHLTHLTLYDVYFKEGSISEGGTLDILNSTTLPNVTSLSLINTAKSCLLHIAPSLASQILDLIFYDGVGDLEFEFIHDQLPKFKNLTSLTFRDAIPFTMGIEIPLNLNSLSIACHHEDLKEYQLVKDWMDGSKHSFDKLKSIKLPCTNSPDTNALKQCDTFNDDVTNKIRWTYFSKFIEEIVDDLSEIENWRELLDFLKEEGRLQFLSHQLILVLT